MVDTIFAIKDYRLKTAMLAKRQFVFVSGSYT